MILSWFSHDKGQSLTQSVTMVSKIFTSGGFLNFWQISRQMYWGYEYHLSVTTQRTVPLLVSYYNKPNAINNSQWYICPIWALVHTMVTEEHEIKLVTINLASFYRKEKRPGWNTFTEFNQKNRYRICFALELSCSEANFCANYVFQFLNRRIASLPTTSFDTFYLSETSIAIL